MGHKTPFREDHASRHNTLWHVTHADSVPGGVPGPRCTMTQYSFPGAGGRGTPAVDPGGQQRSRDGNCSSIFSNNYSVPPSAYLCPSQAPIRAVKPHRLNKKDYSCPAYLPLDCPVFSWLLVTEEEGRSFHTLLPGLSILESPLTLFAAQQLSLQQGRKLQKH